MTGGGSEAYSGGMLIGGTLGVGTIAGVGLAADGVANMSEGFGRILNQYTGGNRCLLYTSRCV